MSTDKTEAELPVTAAKPGWVIMECPICGADKGERCKDTMGKPHPSFHPERRIWSTFRDRLAQRTPSREVRKHLERAHQWLWTQTEKAEGEINAAIAQLDAQPEAAEAVELGHEEALGAIVDCSATTTLLSYREAIEGYLKLRGMQP